MTMTMIIQWTHEARQYHHKVPYDTKDGKIWKIKCSNDETMTAFL